MHCSHSWVEAVGGTLADEEEGVVEVAPLVSYSGEGLEEVAAGKEFTEAYDLDLQGFGAGAATGHAGGRHHSNVGPWLIPFLAVSTVPRGWRRLGVREGTGLCALVLAGQERVDSWQARRWQAPE